MSDHDTHDHTGVPGVGTTISDILDLTTAETDDSLVLAPDGAGGVEFRAETGGGGGSLTTSTNQLGANVTMTNPNQFYDGPSLSLATGTWLLVASIYWSGEGSGSQGTAKLWDGSTVISSAVGYAPSGTGRVSIPLVGTVVLGGTTTIKVSMASDGGSTKMLAAANANSAGNNACTLTAVKIA